MFNLVPATWSHPMTKRGALPLSPAWNKRESGNILCVEHSRQYFVRKRNLTIFWHLTTRVSEYPTCVFESKWHFLFIYTGKSQFIPVRAKPMTGEFP